MSTKGDMEYLNAMLELTSTKQWELLVKEVSGEIYHMQANCLEFAKDWDDVVRLRGYAQALAEYIVNLRDTVKTEIDNIEEAKRASL